MIRNNRQDGAGLGKNSRMRKARVRGEDEQAGSAFSTLFSHTILEIQHVKQTRVPQAIGRSGACLPPSLPSPKDLISAWSDLTVVKKAVNQEFSLPVPALPSA